MNFCNWKIEKMYTNMRFSELEFAKIHFEELNRSHPNNSSFLDCIANADPKGRSSSIYRHLMLLHQTHLPKNNRKLYSNYLWIQPWLEKLPRKKRNRELKIEGVGGEMISFDKYRKNKRSIHLKRGEKYFQFASAALCHMFSQRLRYAKFSRKGADALRLRFEKK